MMKVKQLEKNLRLPTPWQQLETTWSKKANIELWIKRDDLIHPYISGNKWRKLSGILLANPTIQELRTYGGAYSNHLLATAVACHELGIKSYGCIRGEQPVRWSTVLSLCSYYGMELEFISRERYRSEKLKSGWHDRLFHVPEGGAMQAGITACANIMAEDEQEFDVVALACGTGTTLAGLSAHKAKRQDKYDLIGIPVLKGGEFIRDEVIRLGGVTNFNLRLDEHLGGYAKTNQVLMDFIVDFATETEVLLDPVYTAKAALCLAQMAKNGSFLAGQKIGLIHTGGLTGWYGKWTELLP